MKASFHTDESMIVDYLDNNLSQEERAVFEEHLEQCSRCRANVGQQRAWLAKLEAAQMTDDPQAIADPSTLNRIRESLLSDMTAVNQNPISKVQFSRRLSWARVSGIAAAVVVLAVLVFRFWRHTGTKVIEQLSRKSMFWIINKMANRPIT